MSTSAAADVRLTVNGEAHAVPPDDATVTGLLLHLDRDPQQPGVAVAVDDSVVPRQQWGDTALADGARVEIITAQQGG